MSLKKEIEGALEDLKDMSLEKFFDQYIDDDMTTNNEQKYREAFQYIIDNMRLEGRVFPDNAIGFAGEIVKEVSLLKANESYARKQTRSLRKVVKKMRDERKALLHVIEKLYHTLKGLK